eukprot:TRINITY_DN964_c0_g1_i6.p1 TRINITY_DN964_c0_g1~~TRINITY_DN964_c0_g1_i6.p1  ORF type:complete len:993 (+),score=128.24 TRINITY_DN964_c0_g1_i6:95-3073(+)
MIKKGQHLFKAIPLRNLLLIINHTKMDENEGNHNEKDTAPSKSHKATHMAASTKTTDESEEKADHMINKFKEMAIEEKATMESTKIETTTIAQTEKMKGEGHEEEKVIPQTSERDMFTLMRTHDSRVLGYESTEEEKQAKRRNRHCQPSKNSSSPSLTNIMDRYESLSPEYKLIYCAKDNLIKVYKVTLKDAREFILKIREFGTEKTKTMDRLLNEFYLGSTFGGISKNVAKSLDFGQTIMNNGTSRRVEMLIEYGGEPLNKVITSLTKEEFLDIFYQLIKVLELMAEVGVAHFDIKPENVVYDKTDKLLKVIDFGVSIGSYRSPEQMRTCIGERAKEITGYTKLYAPPEMFSEKYQCYASEVVPQKVDVYCFGSTFLELLLLWKKQGDYYKRIINEDTNIELMLKKLEEIGEGQWRGIVEKCLKLKVEERPMLKEISAMFSTVLKGMGYDNILKRHSEIKSADCKTIAKKFYDLNEDEAALWYYKRYVLETKLEGNKEGIADAYIDLGSLYCRLGEYTDAEKSLKEAVDMYEKFPGDVGIAKALCKLGELYICLGKYAIAMNNLKKGIEITKSVYGENHQSLADSYCNLGSVYNSLGQYKEANDYYNKSIEIYKRVHGENHPSLAVLYCNLGLVYYNLGQYKEAKDYYIKAIEIDKRVHGENHPSLAITYSNLGSVYNRLGQYKEAKDYHLKVIEINKRVYGENHPRLAASYSNLGLVYYSLGQYKEAKNYYKKAIEINKRVYGENHPSFAKLYSILGLVYNKLGQYEKAKDYHIKSIEISKKVYGENHPTLSAAYSNLGLVYHNLGQYKDAKEYHIKAIEIKKRIHGENHPNFAMSYSNLGSVYNKLGQYEEARNYYIKAIEINRRVYGENHSSVAASYSNLGSLHNKLGQYKEAKESYIKAREINRKVYGENHSPSLAVSYSNLGSVCKNLGQYKEAKELYTKVIEIDKRIYGENHPTFAVACTNLGSVYYKVGTIQRSKGLLYQSYGN